MSKRPQIVSVVAAMSFVVKCLRICAIFVFLTLLLWSALLRPTLDIDTRWVPKTFFSSAKLTTCSIRMHHKAMTLFEASFFSAITILGYFRGCGGMADAGLRSYSELASFEQAMMGVRQKYYWICFVPWIVTFVQNWLNNVGEFLVQFSGHEVYQAQNIFSAMTLLLVCFMVQALLASEVLMMAVHGWCVMKNINDANVEWERRKRIFGGNTLNTVFGVTH